MGNYYLCKTRRGRLEFVIGYALLVINAEFK